MNQGRRHGFGEGLTKEEEGELGVEG